MIILLRSCRDIKEKITNLLEILLQKWFNIYNIIDADCYFIRQNRAFRMEYIKKTYILF